MTFNCSKLLTECGIEFDRGSFLPLSEAAKVQVTDEVLSGMFKLISDKYNSIDFSEIEKSAGDINKFKYTGMILENLDTLESIYKSSTDPGAAKYLEVVNAVRNVIAHLKDDVNMYSTLYKSGNGMVQLMYTSLVAGCIYSTGTLIANTIQFATSEEETDCEVLFSEIPSTIKHVHIQNILAANRDIPLMHDTLVKLMNNAKSPKTMTESVEGVAVGLLVTAGVIYMIPKIIVLIREIIYSVYFNRVRLAEMLETQEQLIRTNIESLEGGRGNKKVIARQRKIADKLAKWQARIAIKSDATNAMVKTQVKKENAALKVDRDSPYIQEPGSFDSSDLML